MNQISKKNFFKENNFLNRDYEYREVSHDDVETLVCKYGDIGGEIYVNAIGLYNMYLYDINHEYFDELKRNYATLKITQSMSNFPEMYVEELTNLMYDILSYATLLSHVIDDIEAVIIDCLRYSPHCLRRRTSNVDRLFPIFKFRKCWIEETEYKKPLLLRQIIAQHVEYLKLPECCFKPKILLT